MPGMSAAARVSGLSVDAQEADAALPALRFDRREAAGAVADLGVLLPIAVTLIVANGLSPTAVVLPAALLYLVAGAAYRVPVPVQPLKAFGAIAIAKHLGPPEIAAGALLMGAIFLIAGQSGLLDRVARAFPTPLIRGVQLTVGVLFLEIAWRLVHHPAKAFSGHALPVTTAFGLAIAGVVVLLALRRVHITLLLVFAGLAIMFVTADGPFSFGPSSVAMPHIDADALATALTVLVLPQVPLSFANSCLATADAARVYWGKAAARVKPGRLATSLGAANLLAGAIGGMPCCHGAGGMTAHRTFGARTGGAPIMLGAALLLVALVLGAGLATLLSAFPLPILAALLTVAGLLHIGLLRDLADARSWAVALIVGALGVFANLAVGLAVGLALWWLPQFALRWRTA
jgi:SulP family sulfate permease